MEAYRLCGQCSYTGSEALAMPFVALVLLAPVLPLQFPLLNLSTRDRHDARRQAFESLKWRFFFWWFLLFHANDSMSRTEHAQSGV